jgi:hypothetical protein
MTSLGLLRATSAMLGACPMSDDRRPVFSTTWRWLWHDQRAVIAVAVMIVSIDVILALVHAIVMAGWDAPDVLRVDMDGSYAEAYQYVKYIWVIILVAMFANERRNWQMIAWVPLFGYFLADDSILLHERFGYWYSSQQWTVGGQTVGELALSALVFVPIAMFLVFAYVKSDHDTRFLFRILAALVVALMFFAVAVDVIHSFLVDIRILDRGVGFVEDFGEMLVLSVITIVTIRMNTVAAPAPIGVITAEVAKVRIPDSLESLDEARPQARETRSVRD